MLKRFLSPILLSSVLIVAAGAGLWALNAAQHRPHIPDLSQRPLPPAGSPFVVILSLDTVRADHLGSYGDTRGLTPHLDAFAAQSIRFETAISAAPSTLASHTAIFTGTWPHTHGVPRNDFTVDEDNVMLQEVLGNAGWQTAAFIGAIPLASHSGFTQGFDHVDEHFTRHRTKDGVAQSMSPGEDVVHDALAWLDTRKDRERPVFLFVHLFDAHAPYDAPADLLARTGADRDPPTTGSMAHIAQTRTALIRHRPDAPAQAQAIARRYAAAVAHVDTIAGSLLDGLKARDLLDKSVVVVTSDHGESLNEHPDEIFDHGIQVYDETVHVPLIVHLPGVAPRSVPDLVRSIDLFPTLTEWLGLENPPLVEGESWLGLAQGASLPARTAYAEATKPHPKTWTGWYNAKTARLVRQGDLAFMHWPVDARDALFDVAADPTQQVDILGQQPEAAARLRALLQAWDDAASPLPSVRASDARVHAELAALGYTEALDTDG